MIDICRREPSHLTTALGCGLETDLGLRHANAAPVKMKSRNALGRGYDPAAHAKARHRPRPQLGCLPNVSAKNSVITTTTGCQPLASRVHPRLEPA